MPFFTDDSHEAQAYAQVTQAEKGHTAKLSHELIAAAASYEAAKAYEKHLEEQHGKPGPHKEAVEWLAAFMGGFIDRFVETKGLDAFDKERLQHDTHERVKKALAKPS